MRRPAAPGLAALFALAPLALACSESELPIDPEGEPRFTNIVIDKLEADPSPGQNLDAGETVDYDLTATYQLANGWEDEELDAELFIEGWSNGEHVALFLYEGQGDVDSPTGTIRFTGEVQVPNCGDIDELTFTIGLWPADDDPAEHVDWDIYAADVVNAASNPCPL